MQQLIGAEGRGRLFVVSAPGGTGKTTLIQMLMQEFPAVIQSVSFTTRQPREGEVDGVHYNFISREAFLRKIEEGKLLEFAEIYGNFYGTSTEWVEERLVDGKHVALVIDTQGAMQLKNKVKAVNIFIMPPSFEELKRRLEGRQSEESDAIEERLEWAEREIERVRYYDYLIVNDDLKIAYEVLKSIFIAEDHKI